MTILLYLGFALSLLTGIILFGASQSAIQQITAMQFIVVSAILLTGGAIVGAINKNTRSQQRSATQETAIEPSPQEAPPDPPPAPNWVDIARAEQQNERKK